MTSYYIETDDVTHPIPRQHGNLNLPPHALPFFVTVEDEWWEYSTRDIVPVQSNETFC